MNFLCHFFYYQYWVLSRGKKTTNGLGRGIWE